MMFIIFGYNAQLKKLNSHLPVRIFGKHIHPKNLGVWFDANFPLLIMSAILQYFQTCFILMHDLRLVRQYLMDEAAILVANALVNSHLDYCNSLSRSLSSFNMCKLQCIQNTLCRIVTPILKQLQWLPVELQCIFKTATLVNKFLHSGARRYFGPLLSILCGRYHTRYIIKQKVLGGSSILPICTQIQNQNFSHSFTFNAPSV